MRQTLAWMGVGLLATVVGAVAAQPAGRPPATGTAAQGKDATLMRGKIVRVDPQKGVVVIRSGTGAAAKDMEYRVGTTTRYYGNDSKAFTDGLKNSSFKEGAEVWYRMAPAASGTATAPAAGTARNLSAIGFGNAPPASTSGTPGRKGSER